MCISITSYYNPIILIPLYLFPYFFCPLILNIRVTVPFFFFVKWLSLRDLSVCVYNKNIHIFFLKNSLYCNSCKYNKLPPKNTVIILLFIHMNMNN